MEQFIVIILDGNISFFLLCVRVYILFNLAQNLMQLDGKMQLIFNSFHIAVDTYFVICPKLA